MQIQRTSGLWYSAEYSTFSITDEIGKYQMAVTGYSGDAGDALAGTDSSDFRANGRKFTTTDSDNDAWAAGNCAGSNGWWYGWCSTSVINEENNNYGYWVTTGWVNDVQASRMLIKLN